MKKYLLAVSGGPDSMFMLNEYKNKNVVVAHVNYHKREDSSNDERIVREFCAKHSLALEVLNVKESPKGNFQDWAREVRYEFFESVYKKYNCDMLLISHHKDDFLETAWMQMKSGRSPKFFGIKEKTFFHNMNIYRPYVDLYWKDEILKKVEKLKIEFAKDYTNEMPIYKRNEIRLELKNISVKEKQNRFEWFEISNKILNKKFKKVEKVYSLWKKLDYDLVYFRSIDKNSLEVIYELVHDNFKNNKISTTKLEGLQQFLMGKEGAKKYFVSADEYIEKINGKLQFKINK